jgi:DNA-binding MarR family transcriptional regulator
VPVSDLETHLGYLLRAVSNHVSYSFALRLEDEGTTVAEWVMLRALYDEPPTAPSKLADRIGLTRGAISKLAERLIGKGLIARMADAEDGRMQTLALTPAGTALVPRLASIADENDAHFFAHLTTQERTVIETALRRIAQRERIKAVPVD